MGQKAAATCRIAFDGARGWLVGEPHRGLHAMFTMMNTARLGAAIQGLGIAEAAYQDAGRLCARAAAGARAGPRRRCGEPADPIIVHADVRRMLLTMRVCVEGMRALGQWVAQALDRARAAPRCGESSESADEFLAVDDAGRQGVVQRSGFECANLGLQVLGGHGYVRAHGMEQYVRDVRITQIYDGTNGIQALDLVRRKLADGRLRAARRPEAGALAGALGAEPALRELVGARHEAALACLGRG